MHEGKIVITGTATELKQKLPGGQMELKLHTKQEAERARTLLKSYQTGASDQGVVIATDGSAAQAMHILQTLQRAGIEVSAFSQQPPSLDDVFLGIVSRSNKEEK